MLAAITSDAVAKVKIEQINCRQLKELFEKLKILRKVTKLVHLEPKKNFLDNICIDLELNSVNNEKLMSLISMLQLKHFHSISIFDKLENVRDIFNGNEVLTEYAEYANLSNANFATKSKTSAQNFFNSFSQVKFKLLNEHQTLSMWLKCPC